MPKEENRNREHLFEKSALVRKSILDILYKAGASHLGSNMSMVEILVAIYECLDTKKIILNSKDRSRVFVSKGHAAAVTYSVLKHFDIITQESLDHYHLNDSYLTGHVNHFVEGVEHSTGALGHGINVAVGCALGMKARGYLDEKIYAVLGDGEIQEGSVWEAFMFVAHKRLNNLISFIDNNKISSITDTSKVINMEPLTNRFKGFGFEVFDIDGHDINLIVSSIKKANQLEIPSIIICNTIKGKGIPFAENEPIWHYKSLSEDEYKLALNHLEFRK